MDEGQPWFCHLHPTPALQSCSAWDPSSYNHHFEKCPGFFPKDTAPCLPENIDHFLELLKGYNDLSSRPYTSLWWLAQQLPAALLQSQTVRSLAEGPASCSGLQVHDSGMRGSVQSLCSCTQQACIHHLPVASDPNKHTRMLADCEWVNGL